MAIDKATQPNLDNSDLVNFPNARIKDNDGTGDGTAVNRAIYSDIHEFFAKLMRMAAIAYTGLPDSTGNGYQLVQAAIALAGKNDFITPLNTINIPVGGIATDVISVPLALSTLQINEALVCQAAFTLTDQTQIKGSESALQNVTFGGNFKTGDYIRFIKTNTGVTLIRLADDLNLDVLVTELNYLKATTFSDESAGITQTEATTPYTNQLVFAQRVIGSMSNIFLASATRNGLLSAAQWSIINNIPANPIKNVGWISGVDPGLGTIGLPGYAVHGDISSAILQSTGGGHLAQILVTFNNAMPGNYFVRYMVENIGTITSATDLFIGVFQVVNSTSFIFAIAENTNGSQTLKIHFEVVAIS